MSELTFGRDPSSGIVIENDYISRNHGKMLIKDERLYFNDFSTNGSFLNQNRLEKGKDVSISPGANLVLGPVKGGFRVDWKDPVLKNFIETANLQTKSEPDINSRTSLKTEPGLIQPGKTHIPDRENNSLRIGRGADCDVVIDDYDVSQYHCDIKFKNADNFSIRDLGSRNRTYISKEDSSRFNKVSNIWIDLKRGDRIRLGSEHILDVEYFDHKFAEILVSQIDKLLKDKRYKDGGRLLADLVKFDPHHVKISKFNDILEREGKRKREMHSSKKRMIGLASLAVVGIVFVGFFLIQSQEKDSLSRQWTAKSQESWEKLHQVWSEELTMRNFFNEKIDVGDTGIDGDILIGKFNEKISDFGFKQILDPEQQEILKLAFQHDSDLIVEETDEKIEFLNTSAILEIKIGNVSDGELVVTAKMKKNRQTRTVTVFLNWLKNISNKTG